MTCEVLCLRPEVDFQRTGELAPDSLSVAYRDLSDSDVPDLFKKARGLLIPAVGPNLAATLFANTSIRFIQVTGAGLDRLDRPKLESMGIAVANVPGGSNGAVAEYAVTSAALLLRRLAWADDEIYAGNYAACRSHMLSENVGGLDGLLVGIVGFGVIGIAVAGMFHKMGCRIAYYDPMPAKLEAVHALGAQAMSLSQLLQAADVVTLHVPLLPATQSLIGAAELAKMKSGAILVQASRGGVVDEAALAKCLEVGSIGGAAVDVYVQEPPAMDNPLLGLSGGARHRLLVTPHIAGVTRQALATLFRESWNNLERVLLRNEPPLHRAY